MRVTRLSLTNFRVFPELDLEVPSGVVGIYGPNGSGKSTLVESILWALFGVARTAKDTLRADGAVGECRAAVEFEHDGHLYEVTRVITGAAHGVRAEALCDGVRLATGAIAVRQYVHHILGMSAEAFRASVFCEQKQLDAFSGRRPEERRRLVLDLLGITPLDRARDTARARARSAIEQVEAARRVLGDVDALAAEVARLGSDHAAATAARALAEQALAAAEAAERQADEDAATEERRKVERDRLAAAYNDANRRREEIGRRLLAREADLAALADVAERLPALEADSLRLTEARHRLAALDALAGARMRLERAEKCLAEAEAAHGGGPDGRSPDPLTALEEEAAAAARAAGEAAGRVAGLEAAAAAAEDRRRTAAAEAEAAARLDPSAPCPLCGQELGTCFEDVRETRGAALRAAAEAQAVAADALAAARAARREAEHRAEELGAALRAARAGEERWAAGRAEVSAAGLALAEAEARLDPPPRPGEADDVRDLVGSLEAARDEAVRLRERLARSEALQAAVEEERTALAEAEATTARLLEEGRALRFDPAACAAALDRRRSARERLAAARDTVMEARLAEHGLAERGSERRTRLAEELARRGELTGLEDDARHLGRLAELLAEFRNSLVGQVGPALSAETTALFRELTDGRFERLDVDADSFELRVGAAGAGHPLDRHSGSETDLANLSLRVAIGEQVNLLSGGQVGLLVLDEVLGSLDEEHRDRLVAALTRLGARFRQVLVVTHSAEVKEQLPHAIEVVPLARGRSEARLAGGAVNLAEGAENTPREG